MKARKLQNKLKLALVAVFMLSIGAVSAQTATGTDVAKTSTAVRVIDNKGTIKYFQSNNGITQIVNTIADVTTTTWQLGGTLTDNTTLTLASGVALNIGGLTTITDPTTTDLKVLVQDATGGVQEILITDLLQVQSGQQVLVSPVIGANTVTGLPANYANVSVYRNGAKLVANLDYTVAADALTLVDKSAESSPADWTLDAADVIEVQYVK